MDKVDILHRTRLFEMLSNSEIDTLATLCQARTFMAGETIVEEGAVGDGVYILVDGPVEVLRKEDGAETILATLEPPDFFGEMSMIDRERRSATVRAVKDCTLLALSVENLMTFRKSFRDGFTFIVINIARVLSGRLRDANIRLSARP